MTHPVRVDASFESFAHCMISLGRVATRVWLTVDADWFSDLGCGQLLVVTIRVRTADIRCITDIPQVNKVTIKGEGGNGLHAWSGQLYTCVARTYTS